MKGAAAISFWGTDFLSAEQVAVSPASHYPAGKMPAGWKSVPRSNHAS
jgi:hypothetical protein